MYIYILHIDIMRCDSPRDEISQLRYSYDRLKMGIEWDIYIYIRIYTFALINTFNCQFFAGGAVS